MPEAKIPDILAIVGRRDPTLARAAGKVAQLVSAAGGRALLVGGCIRDALIGGEPHDLDIEVYGLDAERLEAALEAEFKLNKVGISFGVIKLSGVDIDVSLPRRENKIGRGHRGFMIEPDAELSFAEACARRDFTCNAMLYDPMSGELIDPHGGVRDIESRTLRQVGAAFAEDPLRVLRAMQFLARFNFTPAPELAEVCAAMTPEGLAIERVGGEWDKLLLQGNTPSRGLAFLRECKWVRYYPELEVLIDCPQYPLWHPEGDVWAHTLHSLDAAAQLRTGDVADDRVMMLAVLCHDFGKPATTQHEADGRITSRGHEEEGAEPTRRFIGRLYREAKLAAQVVPLVENHLKPYTFYYQKASARAIRRLAARVPRLDLLAATAQADSAGRPPTPVDIEPLTWFRQRIEELNVAREAPQPIIKGRDAIALGVSPGREMGRLIELCYEAQLDGAFSTPEQGVEFLTGLIAAAKQPEK